MRILIINLYQGQLPRDISVSSKSANKKNIYLLNFYPQINNFYENTFSSNKFLNTKITDDCMGFHNYFLDSLSITNSSYKELELLKEQLFSYSFYQIYGTSLQNIACIHNFLKSQESFEKVIILTKKGKNSLLIKILLSNLKYVEVKYIKDITFPLLPLLNKIKNYDFLLIKTRLMSYINRVIFKNNIKFIFDNSSRVFEKIDRKILTRSKYFYRDVDYKKTDINSVHVKFKEEVFYNFNLSPLYKEITDFILNFFSKLPSIEKEIQLLDPKGKFFLSNSCTTPVQVAKIFFFNKLNGNVLLKFDGNLSPEKKFWQPIYKYVAGYDIQVTSLFNSSHQSMSFKSNKNKSVVIGSLSLPKKYSGIFFSKVLPSNRRFIVPLTAVNFGNTMPGFQKDIFDNIFYIEKLLEMSRIKKIKLDFKLHPADHLNIDLYKSIINSSESCRIINKSLNLRSYAKYSGVISHSTTLALESFCIGANQIIFNPFNWKAPHDHLIDYQNKLTTPLLLYCKNTSELNDAISICMRSNSLDKLTTDDLHIKYESIMHNFSSMYEKEFNLFISNELGL
jgi:hypothetical protein|tara:strand:+ start:337 stop:2028 length:1692 start_codon:yes stop_codon:yes gene_type:complete